MKKKNIRLKVSLNSDWRLSSTHRKERPPHNSLRLCRCSASWKAMMRPARSRRLYNKRYVRPVGKKVEVYEKLREKNKGSGFSYDQIHMWANILATKRRDPFDLPPAKCFFDKSGKRHSANGFAEWPACAQAIGGNVNDRHRIIRKLKSFATSEIWVASQKRNSKRNVRSWLMPWSPRKFNLQWYMTFLLFGGCRIWHGAHYMGKLTFP